MTKSMFERDDLPFHVVVNEEGQHSIWPAGRAIPSGWQRVGEQATRQACLQRIADVWTDMRPPRLREAP